MSHEVVKKHVRNVLPAKPCLTVTVKVGRLEEKASELCEGIRVVVLVPAQFICGTLRADALALDASFLGSPNEVRFQSIFESF